MGKSKEEQLSKEGTFISYHRTKELFIFSCCSEAQEQKDSAAKATTKREKKSSHSQVIYGNC